MVGNPCAGTGSSSERSGVASAVVEGVSVQGACCGQSAITPPIVVEGKADAVVPPAIVVGKVGAEASVQPREGVDVLPRPIILEVPKAALAPGRIGVVDLGILGSERVISGSKCDSRPLSLPRVQPESSRQPSPPRAEEQATVCPATPVNAAANDLEPGEIPEEAGGGSPYAPKKVSPLGSPPARMMGQSHSASQGASRSRLEGSSSASPRVGNKGSKNLSLSSRGGGPSKQGAKRSSLFSGRPIYTKGQKEPYLKAPRTRVSLPFGRPESFFLDKVPDVDSEGKEITPGVAPFTRN